MKCSMCGVTSREKRIINSRKYGVLCGKCYQREKNNPIRYELPKYGEIVYSPDGLPVCHVCGKAYNKVLSHAWQIHGVSAYDYKKEFGLETTFGIMSEESTELARLRVQENYEVSVKKNLLVNGAATRFVNGHKGRTKDKLSKYTEKKLVENLRRAKINA